MASVFIFPGRIFDKVELSWRGSSGDGVAAFSRGDRLRDGSFFVLPCMFEHDVRRLASPTKVLTRPRIRSLDAGGVRLVIPDAWIGGARIRCVSPLCRVRADGLLP